MVVNAVIGGELRNAILPYMRKSIQRYNVPILPQIQRQKQAPLVINDVQTKSLLRMFFRVPFGIILPWR